MSSKAAGHRITATILVVFLVESTALIFVGLSTYINFVNPYSYVPSGSSSTLEAPAVVPKAERAVVFVLDGVRADIFYQTSKPSIESYDDWANFTSVQCSTLLSVSRTGYAVISSGVNSTESQVISNDHEGTFTGDSLWNVTVAGGGTTAFVGSTTWWELFGPWMNYSILFSSMNPGESTNVLNITSSGTQEETPVLDYQDSVVSEMALAVVVNQQPDLLVVHFGATDEAGHINGTETPSYVHAIENQDTYIGEILTAYENAGLLNSTLVVVTSDHGQVDYPSAGGQHGGTDPRETHTPLMIRGPGVIPGAYSSDEHQNSIAPTVAAALGLRLPSDISGTVLFACMDFSDQEEAVYRIQLSSIRLAEATIRCTRTGYAATMAGELDRALYSLQQARGNYSLSNYNDAIDSAAESEVISRAVMRMVWTNKAAEETSMRLIVVSAVAMMLAAAITMSARLRRVLLGVVTNTRALVLLLAGPLTYFPSLIAAAYLLGWSPSASNLAAYVDILLVRMLAITLCAIALSGVATLLLMRILLRHQTFEASGIDVTNGYRASIAVTYMLAVLVFVMLNGPGLPWYATDTNGVLTYFLLLITGITFVAVNFLSWPLVRVLSKPRTT